MSDVAIYMVDISDVHVTASQKEGEPGNEVRLDGLNVCMYVGVFVCMYVCM